MRWAEQGSRGAGQAGGGADEGTLGTGALLGTWEWGVGSGDSHQASMLGPRGSVTAKKVIRREKPKEKVRV